MKFCFTFLFCLLAFSTSIFATMTDDPDCGSCPVPSELAGCYKIPVVVHVIHPPGDDYPNGLNISCSRICDQIQILNEDFRGANPNVSNVIPFFQPYVGDVDVSFYFHKVIRTPLPAEESFPLINCEPADISPGWYTPVGDFIPLNIWVTDINNNNFAYAITSMVTGTACDLSIPCQNSGQHGIYVDTEAFGFYEEGMLYAWQDGRTVTHEVGHWLGLRHPWGSNPQAPLPNCDCIYDTPKHTLNTCSDQEIYPSGWNVCNDLVGPMNLQNIMAYTEEPNCRVMFTVGQANVMRRTAIQVNNIEYACQISPGPGFFSEELDNGHEVEGNQFRVFPNPVSDALHIDWLDGILPDGGEVHIMDVTGRVLHITNLTPTLNVAALPKGLYLIRVIQNEEILDQQKFVKM